MIVILTFMFHIIILPRSMVKKGMLR